MGKKENKLKKTNMANIICLLNHKGGVAKTTTAQNVGAALSKKYKVLLVDIDPQANLTKAFGVKNNPDNNIYESLVNDKKLDPLSLKKNLDLVPSTIDLIAAEMQLAGETGREYILNELLKPMKKVYDYIILDCPPSLGLLTINALTASNNIFLPVEPEYFGLEGFQNILNIVEKIQKRINPGLDFSGVIITKVKHNNLHKQVIEIIEKHFPEKIFKTRIMDNIDISYAQAEGQSILDYKKDSQGAKDYKALTKEIVKRIK